MITAKINSQERSFLVTDKDSFGSALESLVIIDFGCQGNGRFSNVTLLVILLICRFKKVRVCKEMFRPMCIQQTWKQCL